MVDSKGHRGWSVALILSLFLGVQVAGTGCNGGEPVDEPDTGFEDDVGEGADQNACGGEVELTLAGETVEPGEDCGECGDGTVVCDGVDEVRCVAQTEPNACGGCEPLAAEIGDDCGPCSEGSYECDGEGGLECVGAGSLNECGGCAELTRTPAESCVEEGTDGVVGCTGPDETRCVLPGENACGGAEGTLDAEPGTSCGTCDQGVVGCASEDETTCVDEDRGVNECGGCSDLDAFVGHHCGACDGEFVCDGDNDVTCQGGNPNACGGCEELESFPGESCEDGVYVCESPEALYCSTTGADDDGTNACGGTAHLDGQPHDSCGPCEEGEYICASPDSLTCTGAVEQNACGGCESLAGQPGEECDGGAGVWECDGDDTVVCQNGDSEENACGGTEQLAGQPGEECDGGEGVWECDGNDAVECSLVGGEIFIDPAPVEFPATPAGSEDWQFVEIFNIGTETLMVEAVEVSTGENFDVTFPDEMTTPTDEEDESFGDARSIEPDDDPLLARVWFEPVDEFAASGELFVEHTGGEETVDLHGNMDSACLEVVDGADIDFGSAAIGQQTRYSMVVRNCAVETELEIFGIGFNDDSGGVFSIDEAELPDPLPTDPVILSPGETSIVTVTYEPDDESTDSGELIFESNDAANPNLEIPVSGQGVESECPVADAAGQVGGGSWDDEVDAEPQDVVYLDGEDSYDPDETDLTYEWVVLERPAGSLATLEPDAADPTPQLVVDAAGSYTVELTVYDETGVASCEPARVTIDANPDYDIHLELTWSSSTVEQVYGGPDPDSDIGTDLDLHYALEDATWGDDNGSIYWGNTEQDWIDHGEATLVSEDMYGVDPAVIGHDDPDDGSSYRIGVHYYNDHDYGSSDATVRVYFDGSLHTEQTREIEETDHFWYVGHAIGGSPPTFSLLDDYMESIAELSSADN